MINLRTLRMAEVASDALLMILDTSAASIAETAAQIRDWATQFWLDPAETIG